MRQVLQDLGKGRIFVDEVPRPAPGPGEVLVRTAFSVLSAGTERTKVEVGKKSLLGKALERPDQVRLVLQKIRQEGLLATWRKVKDRLETPAPLGYSLSGTLAELGRNVSGFSVGDRVACAGAECAHHAEYAVVPVNLCAKAADEVELPEAAAATLGAIALQGVRQADVRVGETVLVVGLGLLGQIAAQILKAAGCRVFGVDLSSDKVRLAEGLGMEAGGLWGSPALADRILAFTDGFGADAVLVTAASASSEPVVFGARCARDRARLVVLGQVPVELPRSPFYEKELSVVWSRSYGPGRYDPLYEEKGVDYPIGHVRWTEGRNLSAFLEMLRAKTVRIAPLVTHRFPLKEAPRAFEQISGGGGMTLAVLLEYPDVPEPPARALRIRESSPATDRVRIGMIGAGNFGSSTLLPALAQTPGTALKTLCTRRGPAAAHLGRRFGFEAVTAEAASVLSDPDVDAVVIATRHDTHGSLVADALSQGKAVFVEKPLCLLPEELEAILAAQKISRKPVMVGFNRRFSPFIRTVHERLSGLPGPRFIQIRVNAGLLPAGHWLNDPEIGGGRLRGEACHFIDLALHLAGSPPARVSARSPEGENGQNLSLEIGFQDGSTAQILYTALGDPGLGKERIEVFAAGHAFVVDDFKRLAIRAPSGSLSRRSWSPDKGHRREILEWTASLRKGGPSPIPFEESVLSTRVTFAALESLRRGRPAALEEGSR